MGHGVGKNLHEDPEVPNFGKAGKGPRIYEGMTLAIEPMVNEGTFEVDVLENDWTVVTLDGKLSAHYENTVAITDERMARSKVLRRAVSVAPSLKSSLYHLREKPSKVFVLFDELNENKIRIAIGK